MTFTFKLAHRLARNFWVLGAAAALAGCTTEAVTNPSTPSDTSSTSKQPPTPATTRVGYYVSPSGSSAGNGNVDQPWDLTTAMNGGNGKIQAGDTVWLRAGTYSGNFRTELSGAQGKPIVFRGYPNERATIDGTLRADGADIWFWGFEVMRSVPNDRLPGLESRGARQKYINMIVHDAAQQGITFWDEAVDAELYGNIVYNNGTHENLDHGTYVHNMSGTKLIMDNVFFDNLAYGIHVYAGPTDGTQRNVHVIGNVAFNNGTISNVYTAKGNIIIGADSPDEGMQAIDNMLYLSGNAGENLRVGYQAANNDVLVRGNTVWGGLTAFVVGQWQSATVLNNLFGGSANMVSLLNAPGSFAWSTNNYYRNPAAQAWLTQAGSALALADWKSATGLGSSDQAPATTPGETKVFVRPNKYEPGRALVVIYNWGSQGSVSVNLSGVLRAGQQYEVRNVQDMFGSPVSSGTFSGSTISLPTSGVKPPTPIGRSTPMPPKTGPYFDAFEVLPK
ncbi:MAG TPA: right-handed parallel beta-helix repeat-containing protein [Gemmatimonadales bacterium]|nr:right-handed parallel beta-helix repeat-containing protein [Gemmatimonadales bacterium]